MASRRTTVCGFTPAEMRMWFSMTAMLVVAMICCRIYAKMDYFRILFFSAPTWVTVFVGPLQRDRRLYKLLVYFGFGFIVYWLAISAYPVQCRKAWGTRMISDSTYWGNEQAQRDAIMKEKDNFYVLRDVRDKDSQQAFVGGSVNKTEDPLRQESAEEGMEPVWDVLKQMQRADEKNGPEQDPRIRKWISPLTGGGSLDILKLRAYCNLHLEDTEVPHVYPLRVLGLESEFTMPCQYWTCLLTEVKPDGKQIFWIVIAAFGMATFMHYRMECAVCAWWLGSGQPRIFWTYLWASLLPFLLVLLIKTTCDAEIGILISLRFHEVQNTLTEFFSDTKNKLYFAGGSAGMVVLYIYWEKVRDYLGLPHFHFAQYFMARGPALEAAEEERTFQICIWRLDLHSQFGDASPRGSDNGHDSEGDFFQERRNSSRSLLGSPKASAWRLLTGGGGGSFWGREEDQDTLRTHDGRRPTLIIRFYYGTKEVQRTRVVRPTQSEWSAKLPVYVQENFRLSVAFRPGTPLRVEIQDTGAPLGTVCIGEVSFDEMKLRRQFDVSRHAQKESSQVPVHQVIKMLAVGNDATKDQVRELQTLGFNTHSLSDGGAVWLAFCETDLHQQDDNGGGFCC